MIEVFAATINDCRDLSMWRNLLCMLPKEKQTRIKKFIKVDDLKRAILSELLIRSLICSRLKMDNRHINFRFNKYGKPFVEEIHGFYFNISHSQDWVVCAIDSTDIGIDIEKIEPVDINIARRFFTNEEYMGLCEKNNYEKQEYFFRLWTCKESYVKAIGKGLSIPLNSFHVNLGKRITVFNKNNNLITHQINQYIIERDYITSVCSTNDDFPFEIKFKTIDDLMKDIFSNTNERL